jgi:hypothetical protein
MVYKCDDTIYPLYSFALGYYHHIKFANTYYYDKAIILNKNIHKITL